MNLPPQEDRLKIATLKVYEALEWLGVDLNNAHLADTPRRVTKHWAHIFQPRSPLAEFKASLTEFSTPKNSQLVTTDTISVTSHCAHHLLPYFGYANIGYIPSDKILGLSKFGRVVDYFGAKPGVQEELTSEIAEFLMEVLQPRFLAVVIKAQHTCYDDQTEILTDKGFVKFSELSRAVKVAQCDKDTLAISFVRPSAYIAEDYDGEMVKLKGSSFDLVVTPDHRMLTRSDWSKRVDKPYREITADKFEGGYIPRAGIFEGKTPEFVKIGSKKVSFSNYCKFMGAFLSEGCSSPTSNCVRIKQDENSRAFVFYANFLTSQFEFKFRYDSWVEAETGKERGVFICYDKALNNHLKQFGKSHDKFVPDLIKFGSVKGRKQFLAYYWLGDGTGGIRPDNAESFRFKGYTTVSERLARDVQEMLTMSGHACSVDRRESGAYDVREHFNPDRSAKSTSFVKPKHLSRVAYKGKVYCVTVPKGFIVVRRNGRTAISGNCMMCRGVQKPEAVTTTSYFYPSDQHSTKDEFFKLVMLPKL